MSEQTENKAASTDPASGAEGAAPEAQVQAESVDAAAVGQVEAAEQGEQAEQPTVEPQTEAADGAQAQAAGEAPEAADETQSQVADEAPEAAAGENVPAAEETAEASQEDPSSDEQPAAKAEKHAAKEVVGMGDLIIVGILALILGVLLSLPSLMNMMSGGSSNYDVSNGVAATVNGVAIGENDVTNYIAGFRASARYEDDKAFAEWLVSMGYTPETLRESAIDYFVTNEVLNQAYKENGIEVSDGEVEAEYARYVEQFGGEEEMSKTLEAEGMTLDDVKGNIKSSLMQQALASKVVTETPKADDKMVLEMMKLYYPDDVPESAETLEGLDEELVGSLRSYIEQSLLQESFSNWMEQRKAGSDIVVNAMPKGLPYAVSLEGVEAPAMPDYESLLEGLEVEDDEDMDEGEDEGIDVEDIEIEDVADEGDEAEDAEEGSQEAAAN